MASWRPALLAVLAALIWIVHFDRWTLESWQIPTDYYGDAPETLARLKAAAEGDVIPLRPQVLTRLGAPFGAHWNAYPAPDKPMMLALGALVHLVGLHAAANIGYLLAQVLGVLAFYLVARWLRCRWEWAAAGALLFGFTYHTFHRGLAHYSLLFTWTVPLGLLTTWLVARSRRLTWHRGAAILCLFTGAALGTSNPYNLFFWLQLMAWALLWQWVGPRRWPNLQIGVATVAIALAGFAITNAETWLHVEYPEGVPLLARNYGGTEVYALKPVEMFVPPPFHHWDALAFFGNRYARWSPWRGEVFLPYLGLVGIAGFVWLLIATLRRMLARQPLPGQTLPLAWITAYASVGGITNLLALFLGFQVFRATNRVAIFISAIVLLFLVVRLSRVSRRWAGWQRLALAGVIAAIGVFEQLPRPESSDTLAALKAEVKSDEVFGAELERALPSGAMVFQLPVMGFPEEQAPNQLGEYDHFRPYLVTHDLRFSYGAPKLRARMRWQRELALLPTTEMVHQLENYGFAALYIDRRGYADRGEALLRELTALGYARGPVSPRGDQVTVLLKPSGRPDAPIAKAFTYGQGWHAVADAGWRWAYGDAALSYFNPYPHAIVTEIRLNVVAASERELRLERNGKLVGKFSAGVTPRSVVLPRVELAPGVNRFQLRSHTPAIRQGGQLRSFGVEEKSVRVARIPSTAPRTTIAGLEQL